MACPRPWQFSLALALISVAGAAPAVRIAEPDFDFGTIQPTAPVRHEFKVSNGGDSVLEIAEVKSGCGCTTVEAWDHWLAPGASGRIAIVFNPANFSGSVHKLLTVETNDPAHHTLFLQFQARVWTPIEVTPLSVWFLPIEGEAATETKTVEITSNLPQAVTLEAPHSANAAFKTRLKVVQPGREFALAVTYAYSGGDQGTQGTIELPTSAAERPVIAVTAVVMPRPALVALPGTISIPDTPPAGGYQTFLFIRNNGRRVVALSEPSVNAPGVTARVETADPGKSFEVTLVFPPNFSPPPGRALALTVKTTHPSLPVLTIPIIPCKLPAP